MRTPAGTECRYFYGNYFRGRSTEECRLLMESGQRWSRDLCKTCPMPGILRANACPHLVLAGRVERRLLGTKRQVVAAAVCSKYLVDVPQPHVGCGHCHEERAGAKLIDSKSAR